MPLLSSGYVRSYYIRCSLDALTYNKPMLELPCNTGVLDPSAYRLNTLRTVLE